VNWVLQQPAAIVATATVAIMVGLAVSGLLLFRRLVPQSRLAKSMSVTGQAFTLVGVLYPLVAAFALTTAWDNYQSAQDATEHEAGAVNELLNASEALPAAVRPAVQQQTLAYAQDVVDDEFPRMGHGLPIDRRSDQLRELRLTLYGAQPVTRTEISAYEQSIASAEEISRSRSTRIAGNRNGSTSALTGDLWVLLIGGAFISLAFTYTFATDDVVIHGVCVGLTAALMGFVLYLILALDRPFVGTMAVSPETYQRVIDTWLPDGPPR
jgi:hypothetical protein